MKKFYKQLSSVMFVILVASIPFATIAQKNPKVTRTNVAPSYSYWSAGVFGGFMQFNGDLSRNSLVNLYSKSIGYNVGVNVAKQFTRVIGIRIRFAYGNLHSAVDDKWVWDYQDGNGTPLKVTNSFRSSLFESDLQITVNWLNWILGYKPERIFSSYLIGGVGMDHSSGTRTDKDGKEIAYLGKKGDVLNVGNTSGIGGDNLQFKLVAGLGFDFNLSKHFSVPIEFAWRWQNSDLLDMTRGGAHKVTSDMYTSATIGLTYKFGYTGIKAEAKKEAIIIPVMAVVPDPVFRFSVYAPKNIPVERKVREIFPIRNYVFFDLGSAEIPQRYILLTKDQVKDFKEDQVEQFSPKNITGRSERQMMIYYNILNILGDRMVKNASASIRLTGASMEGPEDGKAMAESVKLYLVNVFGIDGVRISTEGRIKPRIPSEQPSGTKELDLLREGDRRVSIFTTSPALLMEFQSGEDAPLKPIEIRALQVAPFDSRVFFTVEGGNRAFLSWSLEITDNTGAMQNYGPYFQERVSIPGKAILGVRTDGDFKVTMTGHQKNGLMVKRDTIVNLVLWTPPKDEEMMRFSIIYEFNESKAIMLYEKYLTEIVMPKIPVGGTALIQGYSDIIGDDTYNQKLSLERANDVRKILENALAKAGRSDVKFEVYGFGEDLNLSPFENKFPEERFYNRTVIIDIIPPK